MNIKRLSVVLVFTLVIFVQPVMADDARYWVDRANRQVLYGYPNLPDSISVILVMEDDRVTRSSQYWEALGKLVQLVNLPRSRRRALAQSLATRRGGPKLHHIITDWLLYVRIEDLDEVTRSRATGALELKFHNPGNPGVIYFLQYKRERSGNWRFDAEHLCID